MAESSLTDQFTESLEKFGRGLTNVFTDVTTLEVNTIIVSQITGMKFDPEEEYRLIYYIPQDPNGYSDDNLQCFSCDDDELIERFKNKNNENLRKRHMNIRQKLEKVVKNNDEDNDDDKKNKENLRKRHMNIRTKLEKVVQFIDINLLVDSKDENNNPIKVLPSPEQDSEKVKLLLENDRFLRELRKLGELKQVLESKYAATDNVYDIIYAQTVIQLDGDIINRFDRKLFEDEDLDEGDKNFLIKTHNDAVMSGEKNWRELLKVLVELVKDVAVA
jgi:hypothetical protein